MLGQPGGGGSGLEGYYPAVLPVQFPHFVPSDSRNFGIPILPSSCTAVIGWHLAFPARADLSFLAVCQVYLSSLKLLHVPFLQTPVMANISDITSKDGNISVWERKKDGNDQSVLDYNLSTRARDLLVLVEFLAMSMGNP